MLESDLMHVWQLDAGHFLPSSNESPRDEAGHPLLQAGS